MLIRPVQGHEWRQVRELRLRALADDDSAIAFLTNREQALRAPDETWIHRAEQAALGESSRQIVAIDHDDDWTGSVSGIVEKPGEEDFEGRLIETLGVHVVGVWLAPEHRGQGLVQIMIERIVDWARSLDVEQVRMYVHADNLRAQRAYVKAGFRPSGTTTVSAIGPEIEMILPLSAE